MNADVLTNSAAKLRILHIIPSYKPAFIYGGPIYSCSALCEQLTLQGHKVIVATTTANGEEELKVDTGKILNVDGVDVIYHKRLTKDHTHFSPELIKYVWSNAKQFDAVHIHSWWNLVSIFCFMACLLRGIKPIVSPRGMLSDYVIKTNHGIAKKLIHAFINRPFLKRAKFHVTSAAEALEVKSIFPKSSVNEIFNFVNIRETLHSPFNSDGPLNLLFLSRVDPKKGLELLFEALAISKLPYHLNIAGPGDDKYLQYLKDLASQLGISENLSWLGPIYGEKKFDLLASHDLLVLTSHNENFANVVIESLGVGTPVFISENVGLAAYVRDKGLGWVCTIKPEIIASTLKSIFQERKTLPGISQHATEAVKQDFEHANLTQQYISLYKK